MQKEFIIRVVIVGDSNVGKSRLLHQMCRMTFTEGSTVGVDIACREVELEDINYKLMF
jgi:GTPase SAR1 family protein